MKSEAASARGSTSRHTKGPLADTGTSLSGPQGVALRKETLQVSLSPFFLPLAPDKDLMVTPAHMSMSWLLGNGGSKGLGFAASGQQCEKGNTEPREGELDHT